MISWNYLIIIYFIKQLRKSNVKHRNKKNFCESLFFMDFMEPPSIHRCKLPFLRFHEAYFFMEPQFHQDYLHGTHGTADWLCAGAMWLAPNAD